MGESVTTYLRCGFEWLTARRRVTALDILTDLDLHGPNIFLESDSHIQVTLSCYGYFMQFLRRLSSPTEIQGVQVH